VSKIADEDLTVKLGDFGLATEVTGFLHDVVGSDLYHAPEMFTSKGSVADRKSTVTAQTGVRIADRCFLYASPRAVAKALLPLWPQGNSAVKGPQDVMLKELTEPS